MLLEREPLAACRLCGRPSFPSVLVNPALERAASQRLTRLLTTRERQVILLVAEGFSNKVVARRLELTEGTVKIHLHNIYQKLHVNNRTTLAALAIIHRDELASPGNLPV